MVDRFLEAGGNFVDTANVYSRGVSKELTGKALASGLPVLRHPLCVA